MNTELALYREFVHRLSDTKDARIFLNSDKEHAIIVLTEIFRQSNSIVRIFAGNLCKTVGTDASYVAALSNFIERGGKVRILLNEFDKEIAKDSNLYKRIAYHISQGKDIIVKTTAAKPYMTSDPERKEVHFTIGDDVSYRIETNTTSRTAECSMNSPKMAAALISFYDTMFNKEDSEVVNILELVGYDN